MKLVKEDDKLFHFQTPDGDFKVVKKGLSKVALDKINSIKAAALPQKFADGGDVHPLDPDKTKDAVKSVQPNATDQAITKAVQHPLQTMADAFGFADGTPDGDVGQTVAQNQSNAQLDRVLSTDPLGMGSGDNDDLPINPGQPDRAPASISTPPPGMPADVVVPPLVDVSGATDLSQGYQDPALANTPANPSVAPDGSFAAAPPLAPADQSSSLPADQSPSASQAPTEPKNPYDLSSIGQQESSLLNANGKITADTLNKQAAAQAQYQQDQKNAYDTFQKNLGALNAEHDQLFKDVQNAKIDPNRFINSKGAGNKISSAIGIILSGLGSGASGNNLALGVLKDQINKDIDSQKEDLGNKQNLLTQNLHRFGNLYAAENATRTQLGSMYAGQIQQLAMKSGSQMALNNAQMAGLSVRQAIAPAIQQQAMFKTQQAILNTPSGEGGVTDEMKLRYAVPEAQKKDVGTALQQAQNANQLSTNVDALFRKAQQENDPTGRIARLGIESPAQAALKNSMTSVIKDLDGRVNEFEQHNAENAYLPRGVDAAADAERLKNFKIWLQTKQNQPILKQYNMGPKPIQIGAPSLGKLQSRAAAPSDASPAPSPFQPSFGTKL